MPARKKNAARKCSRLGLVVVVLYLLLFSFSCVACAESEDPAQRPKINDESAAAALRAAPPATPEDSVSSRPFASKPESADGELAGWGTISVVISPEGALDAGARWSADGGKTWRISGETMLLAEGDATLVFNNLVGWKAPESIPVKISNGSGAKAAAAYVQLTGSIRAEIDGPKEARWNINGKGEFPGGTLREGIVPGDYTISFTDVEGWQKPKDTNVAVGSGGIATISAAYARTGSVIVMIEGPEEARWTIGEKLALESGALIEGLAPGEYTVSFLNVEQWQTPENVSLNVSPGETAQVAAVYVAQLGGAPQKEPLKAEAQTPAKAATNTGEMLLPKQKEEKAAASAAEEKGDAEKEPSKNAPEAAEAKQPPVTEENAGKEEETDIDTDTDNDTDGEEEKEKDEVVETNNEVITRPRPSPEPPVVTENPDDIIPPEVIRPSALLPEMTAAEREELSRVIAAKRKSLDLGDARYATISAFIPSPEGSLQGKTLSNDVQTALIAHLAPTMSKDAEGNDAEPYLLKTELFEYDAGETGTTGKFLVVRITFTATHSDLASADPKIVSRIEKGVASGRSLGDALLDELRIFKWIGEGENARCFDLVEGIRAGGYSLNSFFEAKAVKNSADEFFDTKAQDASYTVAFTLLVFDGVTNDTSRLVQPLEGAGIIVFDGLKDGKFCDPIILAAPRPKNAQTQGSSSGCATASGGITAALLLLPGMLLLRRRKK